MAAKTLRAKDPNLACHRMVQHLAEIGGAKDWGDTELDKVCVLFERAGGSWASLFEGSTDQLNLLKKAVQVFGKRRKS